MALRFEWDKRKADSNLRAHRVSFHEATTVFADPLYDFSKGVRGKHAARYASGTNVVVLAPDVSSQFPTADDVNQALRAVSRLIERWRSRSNRRRA